jgi:membrane-associated protease RseP (regulator of RpoE activity)
MKQLLTLALLVVGAFAADQGPITVIVPGTPGDAKDAITHALVPKGFSVFEDTTYRLALSKPTSGKDYMLSELLLGNATSDRPNEVVSFDLAPAAGGVLVSIHDEISVQFSNGKVRNTPLKSKKQIQGQRDFLVWLKTYLEVATIRREVDLGIQSASINKDGIEVVTALTPGGPAELAGIKAGDLIVAVDGKKVSGTELVRYINTLKPGDMIHVTVLRNEKTEDLAATLRSPRQQP